MEILFVGSVCSNEEFEIIEKKRKVPVLEPQQKYFNLLFQGITKQKNIKLTCLSVRPVSASTTKGLFWKKKIELNKDTLFLYVPFVNGKILRLPSLYFFTYFIIRKWVKRGTDKNERIVLCDVCNPISPLVRSYVEKHGITTVAYVTDIPELASTMKNYKGGVYNKVLQVIQKRETVDLMLYDAYVCVSNTIIDKLKLTKPAICVEGCASSQSYTEKKTKNEKITFLYAGGIYKNYGVENLIHAFMRIDNPNVRLIIYGAGTYEAELLEKIQSDNRIIFGGLLPASEVYHKELEADVLVNPRPVDMSFAKYSFPSKIIEYISTGNIVLSTKLNCFTSEWNEVLYLLSDDTEDAIYDGLEKIIGLDEIEKVQNRQKIKEFINERLTDKKQGERIVTFLSDLTAK